MAERENSDKAQQSPTMGECLDGRYVVIEQLSPRGFKVKENTSGKQLVLHIFGKVETGFDEYAQRIQDLKHETFVAPSAIGLDSRYGKYTVREYVNGQSLKELLKQKTTLNQIEFLDLFKQASKGLTYLRRKGIVHNNLKPGNLILRQDYILVIVDPSLSPKTNNSLEYRSPEICLELPVDAGSDIYSLGCLMYESLAGQVPFSGGSESEIALKHAQERATAFLSLVPARRVDANVETVIFRCLEKKSSDRYQLSEDLHSDLKRIEEGDEIRPLSKGSGPNTNLLAISAAAVLLLGAGGYAGFAYLSNSSKNNKIQESTSSSSTSQDSLLSTEKAADDFLKKKDYAEASELLNDIEPKYSARFGAESVEHLRVLHKLAKTQLLHKEIPQAKDSYTLLCEIVQKSPGLAPRSFAPHLEVFSIAKNYFEQGEFQHADDSFTLAYNLEREYAGKKSAIEYELLIWKARSEAKCKDFHDAAASYNRAIELLENKFNDPKSLAFALHEYGKAQIGVGSSGDGLSRKDKKNAQSALEKALEMSKAEKDASAVREIQNDLKALTAIPVAAHLDE